MAHYPNNFIKPMSIQEIEDELDQYGENTKDSDLNEFKKLKSDSVHGELDLKIKFYEKRIQNLMNIKNSLVADVIVGTAYTHPEHGNVIAQKFFINPKTGKIEVNVTGAKGYAKVNGTELMCYEGSGNLLYRK